MTLGLRVADPLSVAREAIFEVDGAQDLVAVRGIPFFSSLAGCDDVFVRLRHPFLRGAGGCQR